MSTKSILCVSDGTPDEIACLNVSLALAKANAAKLRIIHVTPPMEPYMEGIIGNSVISDSIAEDNKERLKMAQHFAEHYSAIYQVPLDVIVPPLHHASAQFIHFDGPEENIIAREGRMSDLIVVSRNMNGMNILFDATLLTAMFNTGRPALVVPSMTGPIPREWEFKTITVAWNGSLEAGRALYNAMPALEKAEKVHILIVHNHSEPAKITEHDQVLEYMEVHGVTADIVMVDRGTRSAGEALLREAHELKSDMIVMGAYGHSRAREMILGGVTQYLLKKADIPLLLSH